MSGEVSDSSAQAIGQKLGAQSIISGSIEDMGANYRIRFRTVEVETAAIQVLTSANVRKDSQTGALMGPGNNSAASVRTASPTQYPNGLNFSTGRKVGAGFLNLIVGIGSFTMGDWIGGLIVGSLQLTSNICYIVGIIGTEYYVEYGGYHAWEWEPNYGALLVSAGTGIAGTAVGFARPFNYDKRLAKKQGIYFADSFNPMNNISLIPVSTSSGMGMGVLYNASW